MTNLFSIILKLGMAGSYAIILVLVVRIFLRKAPKIFSYVLWAVVFFRLICPYSLTTDFSIVPESITYPKRNEITEMQTFAFEEVHNSYETTETPVISGETNTEIITKESSSFSLIDTASALWIIGVIGLWGYSVTSLMTLNRKLKAAHQIQTNVYASEEITTPFVLGILNPRIYLPHQIHEDELEYILMHERIHIHRKDYIIKPLAFMIVCLHWFNPLVWAAWLSMSKDMEMSCDEAVIRKMGSSIKKEYSISLLNMASQKTILNASPLAFSDYNAKNRILNVLNYKKPAFWMIAVITVLLTSLSLGLFTNKYKSPELETALQTLAPYLRVKPEDVEVISETSEQETTIYKLSQGDSSISDNLFFLIFKNGELADTYFNLPVDEEAEMKYYTVHTAAELAKQYALDIYQLKTEIDEQAIYYPISDYGRTANSKGMFIEFACQSETQTIYITVSPMAGKIISSKTEEQSLYDYIHYDSAGQSLSFYGGFALHYINSILVNIYPCDINDDYISFNQQIIQHTNNSFTCVLNNEEVELYKYTGEPYIYSTELSTLHSFNEMNFTLQWTQLLTHYKETRDAAEFLKSAENFYSTRVKILHDKQSLNWPDKFKTILNWMDESLKKDDSLKIFTHFRHNENGYVVLTTELQSFVDGSYVTFLSWNELMAIVEEHQSINDKEFISYKIDEYQLLPPEQYWKTTAFSSPEDAAKQFYSALDSLDFSSIFNMMTYREDCVEKAEELLKEEVTPTQIESVEINGNTALAVINIDETVHYTDSKGTTSTAINERNVYLKLLKTDEGWILYDFTKRKTYIDWMSKE